MGLFDKIFGGGGDVVEVSGPFEMRIEDVFSISGRGIVVTGKIASGVVSVGARAVVRSANGSEKACLVAGLESFRKTIKSAAAGESVGVLLRGVEREDVKTGDTLSNARA